MGKSTLEDFRVKVNDSGKRDVGRRVRDLNG